LTFIYTVATPFFGLSERLKTTVKHVRSPTPAAASRFPSYLTAFMFVPIRASRALQRVKLATILTIIIYLRLLWRLVLWHRISRKLVQREAELHRDRFRPYQAAPTLFVADGTKTGLPCCSLRHASKGKSQNTPCTLCADESAGCAGCAQGGALTATRRRPGSPTPGETSRQ
jgi:hypothetical protein